MRPLRERMSTGIRPGSFFSSVLSTDQPLLGLGLFAISCVELGISLFGLLHASQVAGGHAGVGVVSLGGATLSSLLCHSSV